MVQKNMLKVKSMREPLACLQALPRWKSGVRRLGKGKRLPLRLKKRGQ